MNYIKQAKKIKGTTGTILLQLLEMRLDNLVFRLGLAPTIAARQLVSHGHVTVNQLPVSIPSYQCQPGDKLSIKDNATSKRLVNKYLESPALSNIPQHLDFDKKNLSAKILGIIDREWVALKLNELYRNRILFAKNLKFSLNKVLFSCLTFKEGSYLVIIQHMTAVTLSELLDAGVHFGHQASRWNPKMFPYIYAEQNGIHVIDLIQTSRLLTYAHDYVQKNAQNNKTFLFVGTKRQAANIIAEEAKSVELFM